MRTFRVLLAGWALGAATIVALGNAGRQPAVASPAPRPGGVAGRPAAGGTTGQTPALPPSLRIQMPVLGVTPGDLHDTYEQARGGGRTHHALDILAPRGTPVIAAVDGTIRKLFTSAGGGLTIYQYDRDEAILYYYAHLDAYANGLTEGMFVPQGTVLGYVGTTGNAPPGTPHLHFSVEVLPSTKEWWKGQPVNPYPLLTGNR